MAKLLVCDSISAKAVEEMRSLGVTVDVRDTITPEELTEVIGDYDAIVVRSRTKVRGPMLENPGNLKYIIRGGVGVDNIDVEVAKAKGIKVLNTPAATSNSVAELALGLMFALARRISYADATMKAGQWEKKTIKGLELAGKTLGVIGYGRIGKLLGQKARALGMKVVAYDPYVQDEDIIPLEELLKQADYISLHLPHNDETHDLLGAAQFATMKPGVFIVDAARGGVVDEEALYNALVEGRVAGAALDVYTEEPPQKDLLHNLIALSQVVAMPHIGASTKEGQDRIGGEVVILAKEYLL